METIAVVLSVGREHVPTFEQGFRDQELPIWQDLKARGVLRQASLTRMDISSRGVEGATQYLIVAVFETAEGHHEHDNDARFAAWNERADAYQIAQPMAFGGETLIREE
jgi:hypothetical protein